MNNGSKFTFLILLQPQQQHEKVCHVNQQSSGTGTFIIAVVVIFLAVDCCLTHLCVFFNGCTLNSCAVMGVGVPMLMTLVS